MTQMYLLSLLGYSFTQRCTACRYLTRQYVSYTKVHMENKNLFHREKKRCNKKINKLEEELASGELLMGQ